MVTAILFVLMLLVLIIPHELGHMLVAKMCGVQVNEFSVGMGPLIFQRQKGETKYSIRLLPLGGYCQMEGEDEESDNPRAFNNKKPSQKIAVLLAGVAMNVILAVLIVFAILSFNGIPTNTLSEVKPNTPAYEAGIRTGDKITSIDGTETKTWGDFSQAISSYHSGDTMEITALRGGKEKSFYLKPEFDEASNRYVIGVVAGVTKNPIEVLPYSIRYTKELNNMILSSFKMLITGKLSKNEVSGPVGMVKAVDQSRSYGAESYLFLLAVVSLNLAIFNILPFPALDGGRILFVIIRIFTGKAITDDMEGIVHFVGMMLLFGLFIFVTFNDIMNLF